MNQTEIDKYLFNEMPESERQQFEDKFFTDDALFYEIAGRENDLVDRFVRGDLAGDERDRFERSLDALPARRQKVENARVLTEFIAGERTDRKTITLAERSGFFAKFFSFGPAFQFASVGVIVILALATVFLWTENRRLGSLQQELAASRLRESELAARVEEETATSGDLTADLDTERERAAKLEAEIAKLGNTRDRPKVNNPPPMIATLVLSTIGIRDGSGVPVRRLELSSAATRVSIVTGIPSDAAVSDIVSVTLNGELVAENLKTRVRHGEKSIAVTVPAAKLKAGRNELTVYDGGSSVAASYIIAVTKSP